MQGLADTIEEAVFQLTLIESFREGNRGAICRSIQACQQRHQSSLLSLGSACRTLAAACHQCTIFPNLLVTSAKIFSSGASNPTNPTRSLAGPLRELTIAALTEFSVWVAMAPLT